MTAFSKLFTLQNVNRIAYDVTCASI